jgi:hypothetical protein
MKKKITIFVFCHIYFFSSLFLFAHNNDQQTLTFSQAADLAVLASVDLRFSRSSQVIMEKVWLSGAREYFPRISLSVSENDRLQLLGVDSFIKNYGISIDQLLFDGGRLSLSRRIERTELRLSSSRIDRMESDIAEAAISAYRNVLSSRAILEIKRKALGILEDQINILGEEVRLGLALSVDLANAQINLADAKLDVYSLQLDLTEMERQFAELLGLEFLPILIESVDINRATVLPHVSIASDLAREQNPDLIEARFSVRKRRAELRYLSRSWIPTIRLNGNFGLSGQTYPLTRYNWSVGVTIDLSTPLIHNRFSANTGWEPLSFGQFDRTAMIQNTFTPFNDPTSGFGVRQARLAYKLEQEKYNTAFERIGRIASNAIEKCALAEQKRILALEVAAIGAERCRIEELRLNLGQITRLKMMEILIEQTQREIAVIEAATFLLEAERELERFLDLEPGELAKLAILLNESNQRRK